MQTEILLNFNTEAFETLKLWFFLCVLLSRIFILFYAKLLIIHGRKYNFIFDSEFDS